MLEIVFENTESICTPISECEFTITNGVLTNLKLKESALKFTNSYYEELTPLQRIKKFYDITYIKLGNLKINVKCEIDVAEENPSQHVTFTPDFIEVHFYDRFNRTY